MSHLMKRYCFKRLPILGQNAAIWMMHIAQNWSVDFPHFEHPVPAQEIGRVLERYMPELLPDFESLLSVAPDRPNKAQIIAMYNLPPFFSGCSNSISHRLGYPTLIRNYDFGINRFSGVFRYEPLPDGGWIIGSAEGGWGYLDGLNHQGLAVAITFGGSYMVGEGFSVPLIVRYLLTTSATVPEAVERLMAVPHQLAQNFSLLDREGRYAVVYASPQGVTVDHGLICCTNHQGEPDPTAHVEHRTVERFDHLYAMAGNVAPEHFLQEPLYNREFSNQYGTLYTVEIDPVSGKVHYYWPEGRGLTIAPESPEMEVMIPLLEG